MDLTLPGILNPVHPPESGSQHWGQDPFRDSTLSRIQKLVQILVFLTVVTIITVLAVVTFVTIVTITTTVLTLSLHLNIILLSAAENTAAQEYYSLLPTEQARSGCELRIQIINIPYTTSRLLLVLSSIVYCVSVDVRFLFNNNLDDIIIALSNFVVI